VRDELIRRLTNGDDVDAVRADFERELEEAKTRAEQIVSARERLNDWVADAIEAVGRGTTNQLLRAAVQSSEPAPMTYTGFRGSQAPQTDAKTQRLLDHANAQGSRQGST
jgi:hypothetical protein